MELSYLEDKSRKWKVNIDKIKNNCKTEDDFEKLNLIGEGSYGIVYRARDKITGEIVALKRVKLLSEGEGLPLSTIREIRILEGLKHMNIVNLKCVIMGKELGDVYLNMEYCEHDLSTLIKHLPAPFSESQIKGISYQVLEGLHFLHSHFVVHRDMKVSNILLNSCGIIKIADFGLARTVCYPYVAFTPIVATLWYRPPEILFGSNIHSPSIDLWSFGCILAELYTNTPLFLGENEIHQINCIIQIMGTPNDDIWPNFSDLPSAKSLNLPNQPYNTLGEKFRGKASQEGINFLQCLLLYDPLKRYSAQKCLEHDYFHTDPLPLDPSVMPTFPEFRNLKFKNIK